MPFAHGAETGSLSGMTAIPLGRRKGHVRIDGSQPRVCVLEVAKDSGLEVTG